MRTRTILNELLLAAVAAASLATLPVACGSYTSTDGSGGGPGAKSGGATGNGGATSNGGANGGTTSTGGAISNGGTTATQAGGVNAGGATNGGASSGGATGNGGATKADAAVATGGAGGGTSAGGTTGDGGSSAKADAAANGGATGTGGSTVGTGGSTAGTGGSTGAGGTSVSGSLPCDIFNAAGQKCVAAHSTVRVILTGYTGPLYQVCKGTANTGPSSCKGTPQDIGSKNGYADAAAQDTFCSGGTCTITKIYDQSGMKNDLEPAPQGGVCGPDKPANAADLKVTINGNSTYGILIKAGVGYRTGCSGCTIKTGNGTATGDQPESMYMVTSQKDLVNGCCFDYGNAETSSHDDGNGTMETIYFGAGVVWGTGSGGQPGPWVEADLENGLYAGWENGQDKNISTNKPLKFDFVTAIVLGDTKDKNSGKGRFALYGADATGADATYGKLATLYDGIRPAKNGYVPMQKQGSIILGIGGDNSCSAGGRFYEGAMTSSTVATQATLDALQAAIVAAKYGQ
jgi:non-reducing end alpha-L-arabinofuranosidase